jgi:hypothetical protein
MCGEELEMHHTPRPTLPSYRSCRPRPLQRRPLSVRYSSPVSRLGRWNPPAMRMAAIPPDPLSPPPISRLLFRRSGIRACCYASGDGGTKRAFHVCRAIPEATRVARAGPQKLGLRQSNEICGGHASIDCGLCPEQAIECRVLPHSAPSSSGLL